VTVGVSEATALWRFINTFMNAYAPKDFAAKSAIFSFVKKCKFHQKFGHKSPISSVFRHPKMRPFQQCMKVTAFTLFCEVLPKQFEAFGFYFSQEKKTGDC